ncbi:MAG TPA: prepilin-type N-terminal cleavage/methylation domain-containing protein [Vicinamibacterales bacterium]|nr:prepilin-type N-terminal cleavage/methylation domain-containing protein [Vicinamibacterales bacterium]
MTPRRTSPGFTLVEAVVALAVVATGVVAAERLLARSARTVAVERAAARAQLAAHALLAEARADALPLGTSAGTTADGVLFERDVRATPHPALREVRVRTEVPEGAGCELVEILRAPLDF